ncbi:MAG: hypothetical protein PVJ27_06530 [Candidatus Brocadiaceae bacterium]|jgi:hypothetical protein
MTHDERFIWTAVGVCAAGLSPLFVVGGLLGAVSSARPEIGLAAAQLGVLLCIVALLVTALRHTERIADRFAELWCRDTETDRKTPATRP